jgi:hypothetical protein
VTAQDIAQLQTTSLKLGDTATGVANKLLAVTESAQARAASDRLRAVTSMLSKNRGDILTLAAAAEELANAHKDALTSVSSALRPGDSRDADALLRDAETAEHESRRFEEEAAQATARAMTAQRKATEAARNALNVMQSMLSAGSGQPGSIPSLLRERNDTMMRAETEYRELLAKAQDAVKRCDTAKESRDRALRLRACATLSDRSWADAILRVRDTARAMQRTYSALQGRHNELLHQREDLVARRDVAVEDAAEAVIGGVRDALVETETELIDAALRQTEPSERAVRENMQRLRDELRSLEGHFAGLGTTTQTLESLAERAAEDSVTRTHNDVVRERAPAVIQLLQDLAPPDLTGAY